MTIAQSPRPDKFPPEITELRLQLRRNGFEPLPARGEKSVVKGWPHTDKEIREWGWPWSDEEEIRRWAEDHRATNTGLDAKFTPGLYINIWIESATKAVEDLAREFFAEHGDIHVRLGLPAGELSNRRLILLRTDEPFAKLSRTFIAPDDDSKQTIEILGDGQKYVVDGTIDNFVGGPHYRWNGGDLASIKRENLPPVRREDMERFLEAATKLLVKQFGYVQHTATLELEWLRRQFAKQRAQIEAYKAANPEPSPRTLQEIRKVLVELKEHDKKHNLNLTVDEFLSYLKKYYFELICDWRHPPERLRHHIEPIWAELARESSIPADTLAAIQDPSKDDLRWRFWNIMMVLKRLGFTSNHIIELFERHPKGIASRYRGRLHDEVERAWNKIRIEEPPTATPAPVFDPWQPYIVPAFPLDVLPSEVQDFVAQQAQVIGCDMSGMAMATLATFSGAIDHRSQLKMMRNGNWGASPRLWVLLVGDPSTRRTPLINAATMPLEHQDYRIQQDYQRKLAEYLEAKENKKDAGEKLPAPIPPKRYVIRDTTVEKLGEILARHPKGALVKADEMSGWLASMERYSHKGGGSDRAFWLKTYDGGPYTMDRISRRELFIENLSVSLLGGIQPARLAEIQGLTSDGLLQRLLPVMIGDATFPQDRQVHDEKYGTLVREMYLAPNARLIMTDNALVHMERLRQHLFNLEKAASGFAPGFKSFVGKLYGICGTLALILHLAENPRQRFAEPVEENTIEKVRRLMLDFILPHGFEFYGGADGTNGDRLRQIASWILTSGKKRLVASDITTNIADCRGLTLREIQERVSPLVAGGWLSPHEDLNPLNRAWTVAPQVHEQLAKRAKDEEARKAALAALINSPRQGDETKS